MQIHPLIADIRNAKVMTDVFEKYRPAIVDHTTAYNHVLLMVEKTVQAIFRNVQGSKNPAEQ